MALYVMHTIYINILTEYVAVVYRYKWLTSGLAFDGAVLFV